VNKYIVNKLLAKGK
jgi:hypothetical protein